jgi:hypothetical protein
MQGPERREAVGPPPRSARDRGPKCHRAYAQSLTQQHRRRPDRDIECIWGGETEPTQEGAGVGPSKYKGWVCAGCVRKHRILVVTPFWSSYKLQFVWLFHLFGPPIT